MTTLYDFNPNNLAGKPTALKDYKGKVALIVNVASACGLTPQYKDLEDLYQRFGKEGFVVLGFPCNQFGAQEPGSAEEIKQFCDLKYKVTFPMFEKIEVNGKSAAPLYQFLKEEAPGETKGDIEWNFGKFLVNRSGKVVGRFHPKMSPQELVKPIKELLVLLR